MVKLETGKYYRSRGGDIVFMNTETFGVTQGESYNRIYCRYTGRRLVYHHKDDHPDHLVTCLENYNPVTGSYEIIIKPVKSIEYIKINTVQGDWKTIPIKEGDREEKIDEPLPAAFVSRDMDGWDLSDFQRAVAVIWNKPTQY